MKNLVTQVGNSKEILTSRIKQTEDRISGLKDKIEDLDQIRKGHEIFFLTKHSKGTHRNCGTL